MKKESDGSRTPFFQEDLVPCWKRQTKPFFTKLVTQELKPLILRERQRSAVSLALHLARWILHIRLHQLLRHLIDRDQAPGMLRVVVHEDVVTFLWVSPKIEHLRNSCNIL